ncbi:MAG: hypothetical protein IPJ37_11580 [Bacteroidales bacterium]|nr:hypothetical protein [Bacteroidales bacterium]
MAAIIGENEKSDQYSELAEKIKASFREHFMDADGKIEGDAQACYALALFYEICPKEMEQLCEKG